MTCRVTHTRFFFSSDRRFLPVCNFSLKLYQDILYKFRIMSTLFLLTLNPSGYHTKLRHKSTGVQLVFSFAPELVSYSAPSDLHRRAAYSICESWFLSHQDFYHDLFVCSR